MIKSTGITRKVDELGRIVIPMEYNDSLICSKCQSKIAELNQKAEVSSQEATINTDNVNLNNSNYN